MSEYIDVNSLLNEYDASRNSIKNIYQLDGLTNKSEACIRHVGISDNDLFIKILYISLDNGYDGTIYNMFLDDTMIKDEYIPIIKLMITKNVDFVCSIDIAFTVDDYKNSMITKNIKTLKEDATYYSGKLVAVLTKDKSNIIYTFPVFPGKDSLVYELIKLVSHEEVLKICS